MPPARPARRWSPELGSSSRSAATPRAASSRRGAGASSTRSRSRARPDRFRRLPARLARRARRRQAGLRQGAHRRVQRPLARTTSRPAARSSARTPGSTGCRTGEGLLPFDDAAAPRPRDPRGRGRARAPTAPPRGGWPRSTSRPTACSAELLAAAGIERARSGMSAHEDRLPHVAGHLRGLVPAARASTATTYLASYDGEWIDVGRARAARAAGADVHLVLGDARARRATARQRGVRARWCTSCAASPAYRALRQRGLGPPPLGARAAAVAARAVRSRRLAAAVRAARALRPDVVVVQDYEMPRFDVAALALPRLGLRVRRARHRRLGSAVAPRRGSACTARRARRAARRPRARGSTRVRARHGHPRRAAVVARAAAHRPATAPRDRAAGAARLGRRPGARASC